MARYFHVSSTTNRESISTHGLDWSRIGAASGIAGSDCPEQEGCFMCLDEWEADWFVDMNNTGGAVDVWAVEGVDESELLISPEGHHYVPRRIPPEQLRLVRSDVPPKRC